MPLYRYLLEMFCGVAFASKRYAAYYVAETDFWLAFGTDCVVVKQTVRHQIKVITFDIDI